MDWYKFLLVVCLIFHAGVQPILAQTSTQEIAKVELKMGSRFEIIAVTNDSLAGLRAIAAGYAEIDRIENLISSWKSSSQTSLINTSAGTSPVSVEKELRDLIFRSIKVSELTDGAFDITFAGIDALWKFDRREVDIIPDSNQVAKTKRNINYQLIELNPKDHTVYLPNTGMKIGFGSIGKGYAANRAMEVMKRMGVHSGMINAGGDLITWGETNQGDLWSVGIADPNRKGHMLGWLTLKDMALVTSGDYEKYFIYQGQRYGHIIDPRTGYPASGVKSVSILCPDAELADALATAVYVLGPSKGMELVNKLNLVEGLIITSQDKLLQSDNLTLEYYATE